MHKQETVGHITIEAEFLYQEKKLPLPELSNHKLSLSNFVVKFLNDSSAAGGDAAEEASNKRPREIARKAFIRVHVKSGKIGLHKRTPLAPVTLKVGANTMLVLAQSQ
jgi:hypothetical protein